MNDNVVLISDELNDSYLDRKYVISGLGKTLQKNNLLLFFTWNTEKQKGVSPFYLL